MRILAINSSHRGGKGFTQALLERMKEGAKESGADFETVILADCMLNRCLGCEACHMDKSYLKCVYEGRDDMKGILDRMAAADIIVYATPVYVFSMSGLMKCFLDRLNSTSDIRKLAVSKRGLLFHHIDAAVCSKPFVPLVICGNIEDETVKNTVSYFKTFSRFMDAPMVGLLVRKLSFILQSMDEGASPKLAAVLGAFYRAGRELAISGRISGKTSRAAARNVLEIPAVVRLLMKIRPLRFRLVKEGLKRNIFRL